MNTTHKLGSNQHETKQKYAPIVYKTLIIFTLLIWIIGREYTITHPMKSPCADTGCFQKVVYTHEELSDIEKIPLYIATAFKPFGTEEVYRALSVAKNESGWNKNAKGWNCHYLDQDGKQYSDACKPEDRAKAWSVDCGIMQINVNGQVCPEKLLNIKENINIAVKMYKSRGWQPWVVAKKLGYVK